MKRTLIVFSLLILIFSGGLHAAVVSLAAGEGHPGDTVSVSVSLEDTGQMVAAEISIPLDTGVQYVPGSFRVAETLPSNVSCSFSDDSGKLKILLYSTDLSTISAQKSPLLYFNLKLGREPAVCNLMPQAIISDANGESLPVSLNGAAVTILAPKLEISAGTIDFGHVAIRGSYSRNVSISNTGTEELVLSSVYPTDAVYTASVGSMIIPAGETSEVSVCYRPVTRGIVCDTIFFESDACNGIQALVVTADAYSVNELYVGSAWGMSENEVTVALSMKNMEPITAVQCSFILPSGLEYVANSLAKTSRSNSMMTASSYTDSLLTIMLYSTANDTISGNEGDIATFQLKLTGSSGSYLLIPTDVVLGNSNLENMVSATDAGIIEIAGPEITCDSKLDFGNIPIAHQASVMFMISNTGKKTLTVDKIVFQDEGFLINETLPVSIEVEGRHEFEICYSPQSSGGFASEMDVYSDDPAIRVQNVKISGHTFEPNALSVSNSFDVTTQTYMLTVSMDNYSSIAAVQMDIQIPEGLTTSTTDMTLTDRCNGFSYNVISLGSNSYRVLIYTADKKMISGNSGVVFGLRLYGLCDDGAAVSVTGIILSDPDGVNVASVASASDSIVPEKPVPGDANGSGVVDVADIAAIVEYIYGNRPENFVEVSADVNGNGSINVADITAVLSIIQKTE